VTEIRRDFTAARRFDTTWIVRYNRTAGKPDTLTTGLRHSPSFYSTNDNSAPRPAAGVASPGSSTGATRFYSGLLEQDFPVMFADGWVAVARFNPYRVEWCSPAGRCSPGPVIEERTSYTDAEKRAYVKVWADDLGRPTDPARYTGWPPTIPPFAVYGVLDPVIPMPNGRVLIERVRTIARPANNYDIIDRRGIRVGTVALPVSERVVGFGKRSVYTLLTDANDLQRIRRHAW
jgi:hypothetical protein